MEKALRKHLQGIILELLCIMVPVSIAGFFLFYNLDILKDLNHNVANIWYFNSLGQDAHTSNVSVMLLLEELCKKWTEIPGHFNKVLADWYVFAIPLSHVWISMVRNFLTPETKNVILSSSIIGFASVIMTYITGRVLYNRQVGLFSALYLGISLIFILTVRNGYVFYSLDSFLGLLVILIYYLAHKTENKNCLYLSAVAFSVGWFNGYSMFLIFIPVILLAFIIYGRRKRKYFTFEVKQYRNAFIIAFGLYFVYSMIYSKYLNIGFTETFLQTHGFFFWRSGSSSIPLFNPSYLMENIKRGVVMLFYNSYLPPSNIASADNVAPYGQPGIPPLIAFFILYGVITMYRHKTINNILLMLTLLITSFFVFFMLGFDTRYLMVTLPFFYIAAGVGTKQLFDKFKTIGRSYFLGAILSVTVLSAISYTIYNSYDYFFNKHASNQGYMGRWDGLVRAGNYINKQYDPDDTFVVLGDKLSTTEDIFAFSTMPKSFEYAFWENIQSDYKSFESNIFKRKKKIVFALSNGYNFLEMPGFRYTIPVDWEALEDIYPDILYAKQITSNGRWPLVSILELPYYLSNGKIKTLKKENNFRANINNTSNMNISAIKFTGDIKSCELSINSNTLEFSLDMKPSMELVFLREGNGKLKFTPYFNGDTYIRDVHKMHNVQLSKEDSRYIELTSAGEGHLIYKMESPTKIISLDISTLPRVFNDKSKSNSLSVLYSYDGENYDFLYEVKSSGSGEWDLHFRRDTFHSINPGSKTVYIKFIMKGNKGDIQLWSPPPVGTHGKYHVMKFIAEIEPIGWNGFGLKKGRNNIAMLQELQHKTGTLKIYVRDIAN